MFLAQPKIVSIYDVEMEYGETKPVKISRKLTPPPSKALEDFRAYGRSKLNGTPRPQH